MSKIFFVVLCMILAASCKKPNVDTYYPPPIPVIKIPAVVTNDPSDVTRYSVILSGVITDTGKATINDQGFLIDTLPEPTIAQYQYKVSITLDSIKTFTVKAGGLPANKYYFVRAYAQNPYGIAYGKVIKFASFQEKIFNDNIYLKTQQQVEEFGANNYSRIKGELNIDGPVTDLSPLKSLVVVNSGFKVKNTLLENFKGLENLQFTGYIFPNDFRVEHNPNLKDFSGLSSLQGTRGLFYVIDNPSLTSMDGFDSLLSVGMGEFRIQDCDKLENIDGLKNMVFVGSSVYLINNPLLTNIKGFRNLSTIKFGLYITNNASLQNLDGLEKIEELPFGFELTNNTSLKDIKGISNLSFVGDKKKEYTGMGVIVINGNTSLKNLSAFGKITNADYVVISNNTLLQDLAGFNNLEKVTNTLKIENNPALQNLAGLGKLNSVGLLGISFNNSLVDLKGLENLTVINGPGTGISSNKNLQSLTGLENVIWDGGPISILGNPALIDFCPLKPLFKLGYNKEFLAKDNAINPSQDDIITMCQ